MPPVPFLLSLLFLQTFLQSGPQALHEIYGRKEGFNVFCLSGLADESLCLYQALCHFSHDSKTTCASCAPPKTESYVGKKDCDKGHQPWPYGVCLSCAPPNALIKPQVRLIYCSFVLSCIPSLSSVVLSTALPSLRYRQCRVTSFCYILLQLGSVCFSPLVFLLCVSSCIRVSCCSGGIDKQKAAILLGKYKQEEKDNPGAVRALIHAVYEFPQVRCHFLSSCNFAPPQPFI
jgi:hypothetical protein